MIHEPIEGNPEIKTQLLVVFSADRGLCGGFNSNICKLAKNNFKKILSEGKDLKIITVGSKGLDQIKREYGKYVIKKFSFKEKKQITFEEANIVGNEIISLFNQNEFDKCILFFNNFKNVITQIPQSQQIIPVEKITKIEKNNNNNFYEFEPDEEEILEDLLPKNISTQLYRAFLENAASEQGSRMTAMDNATRNAGDLVEKLTINYNRSDFDSKKICFQSYSQLDQKNTKIVASESWNFGKLLKDNFHATSEEKADAKKLENYYYEYFIVRVGAAPYRGFGSSVKKAATDSGNDGMAYRIHGCGLKDTGDEDTTFIVALESVLVLPK